LVSLWLLPLAPLVTGQSTRPDGLCGPGNPAANGVAATCEHIPPFPTCCQANGHCGWDCEDAAAPSPVEAPVRSAPTPVFSPAPAPSFPSTGRYRPDGRCGPTFPLEDGGPTECDPNSEYWCCSEHGYCGGTDEHCYCDTCANYRPLDFKAGGSVRSDRRCGKEFPLPSGLESECDGSSENPCCSKHGYCGPGPEHCDCPGCTDYRSGEGKKVPLLRGKVRLDRRCGPEFLLEDGSETECDGASENPCCSKWGYCGPGSAHCECPTCKDYRTADQKLSDWEGTWRKDRRCGPEFPIPESGGEPGECNPNSDKFCCSKWGYCGGDEEHCGCAECVNYAKK